MTKNKKQKRLLSPIIAMVILILVIAIGSGILAVLNVEGSQTSIVDGSLETSIVVVKNIFSREGLTYFFSDIISNFSLLEPFIFIVLSLMVISIGKTSGLFKHLFTPLRILKSSVLTFIVVLVGVISTVVGDYSYILLIPLVAILYQYVNKSPVLGIITMFLGITLGYGTGIFYNYNDYALGVLTQSAAVIDLDSTYRYTLYSNIYIMITSTIALSFIATILIERYLSKKVLNAEPYEDEIQVSKKALIPTMITFLVSIIPIFIMILPNGILLDTTQEVYVAKLFSSTSPFNLSFMFLCLFVMGMCGLVYGLISKNFKTNHDFSWGFAKQYDNIGYLFVLMFLSSILLGIVNWTNIGVVVANKLVELISVFDFTGIPLIVITFILIIVMSVLLPGSLEKWALISPILIPLFMRGNLTPDFAQFVFKAADSVGKVVSPLFIYFIMMIGFVQKYNVKENKITLFSTIKLIWPVVITMIIFWLLLLVTWYIASLPLGIGTYATM